MDLSLHRPPPRVVWSPLAGSQTFALSCPANHILYEGTRGPGKTDTQLMFFRKNVGQGYGAYWRGVIFDREYKNLDDLVAKSRRWFPQFEDGAEFRSSTKDYKWVWPTGEELLFRSVLKEQDYWDYHGQEFPFIGWNELCKYPTRKLYDAMMSCNRSSFLPLEHSPDLRNPLPEIPLVVFSTANPYGPGHNWVKTGFIDVAAPGEVVRRTTNVFNPRTQEREDIVTSQVRIFGSYKENRYLSPIYVAELESITDQNKRRAWLWGDWDIVAGGALDDVWDNGVHVLPRFPVPASWRLDRSFDWGSTQPFSVGWWAEANGEEVELPDGRTFCPPKGSLIRFFEWYGCKEIGTNEGLRMSAPDVARGILRRETGLMAAGWITRLPSPGPADNAIRNVVEKESDSIEKKMTGEGVRWTNSDKKPGSRIVGLQLIRDMLLAAVRHAKGEPPPEFVSGLDDMAPNREVVEAIAQLAGQKIPKKRKPVTTGIYVMDCCKGSLATLPVLPRDPDWPDDVDTEAEDHIYDDWRYRALAGNIRGATSLKVTLPT